MQLVITTWVHVRLRCKKRKKKKEKFSNAHYAKFFLISETFLLVFILPEQNDQMQDKLSCPFDRMRI